MGLTWYDQPTGPVVDLRPMLDRIIDIRTSTDRRGTIEPSRAEAVAVRWTVLGVRCSIELSWGADRGAVGEPRPVASDA